MVRPRLERAGRWLLQAPRRPPDGRLDNVSHDGRGAPIPRRRILMATYTATVAWERGAAKFTDNRYPRAHRWTFDGGAVVPASSSPHVVPVPLSDAAAVDPEEAFVASLSSCHMLYFLFFAAKRGFVVDSYVDRPIGHMGKNERTD